MPSRRNVTPGSYLPSDRDLLAAVAELVEGRPCASLREVCGALWPDLAWAGGGGNDSAQRLRSWPGGARASAAQHLADRLQRLVILGALQHGTWRRDEVDVLAGLAYCLGSEGAVALIAEQELRQEQSARTPPMDPLVLELLRRSLIKAPVVYVAPQRCDECLTMVIPGAVHGGGCGAGAS